MKGLFRESVQTCERFKAIDTHNLDITTLYSSFI